MKLPFRCFVLCLCLAVSARAEHSLENDFQSPPDAARPWVYWYFMDGNLSREGITADLEAMAKAGIGGAIYLEVDIGIPRGPVAFMSPEWQKLFNHAATEADRLGIELALGTGPGWCGSGGPWVKPEMAMKHLVASETKTKGPIRYDAVLPKPEPRQPFFGMGTLTAELNKDWREYYRDVAVLAYPTPADGLRIQESDEKALYYRAPYSSSVVKPYLPAPATFPQAPAGQCIPFKTMVDLTSRLQPDGRLAWDVPPGDWTILRFGSTLTGQTTRPAPQPGLGFECDKFDPAAAAAHLAKFPGPLLEALKGKLRPGRGLTGLHFDSWEMGAQNWTDGFRETFRKRRGYDPLTLLPALTGRVVESTEMSERFLWDLRQTAQELVIDNHVKPLRDYAHAHGLRFSSEPYDMDPCSDLEAGAVADVPMCEFWSQGYGFSAEYSCFESVSIAHTNGRPIVGAESFTANPGEDWRQFPGSMKAQGDWALCTGINRFTFHRFQHQPVEGKYPGMTMGPYGVYWDRTQTWWDMVPAYHTYLSRCQQLLRQGLAVADILYLEPEGAPHVFRPPGSATEGKLPDRRGYNFDGCAPGTLMARATVENGRIRFPDGMSYRVLVLPDFKTMTPQLLRKIGELVAAGATIVGNPPEKSPGLQGYPKCDAEVAGLAAGIWNGTDKNVVRPAPAEGNAIANAKWIWQRQDGGFPPVAEHGFVRTVEVDVAKPVDSAVFQITADNTYQLSINGKPVGKGDNFHNLDRYDVSGFLVPGRNEVRVLAANTGDGPNPAGWIGSLVVRQNGSSRIIVTDSEWTVGGQPSQELGAAAMGPWNLAVPGDALYPEYEETAGLLGRLGVAPDFTSDASVRYIHRRLDGAECYFIANREDQETNALCRFRVAGLQPEWWNPLTGGRRLLPRFDVKNGVTSIPIRLGPLESGFVMFRGKPQPSAAGNHAESRTLATLEGAWKVTFDKNWGGPGEVEFAGLEDWSKRAEEGIRYYSGKAVYRKSFDLTSQPDGAVSLGLGDVRNLATVRLNGTDLGAAWCAPWQVTVPQGLLKSTGNVLEITVANLWINRLIKDSGLPEAARLTSTTRNPYKPDGKLQTSGLLGPVRISTTR